MQTFVTAIHVTTCVLLILLVMLQSGKGADISASFGGSSQTVFGSSGGANFFTRFTAVMAAIFFTTSLALTILTSQSKKSLFEGLKPVATETSAPAAPAAGQAAPPATAPATAEAAKPAEQK